MADAVEPSELHWFADHGGHGIGVAVYSGKWIGASASPRGTPAA